MANKKISELDATTTANDISLLNIVQEGQNRKITKSNFLKEINSKADNNANNIEELQQECENNNQAIETIKPQVESNTTEISNLQKENEELKSIINQLPSVTGEGTNINLQPTIEAKLKDVKIKGNTYQTSYTGKNLFDIDSAENITINSSGVAGTNNDYRTTDYLSTQANLNYYFSSTQKSGQTAKQVYIAYYDENKAFLSRESYNEYSHMFTTPANCLFMRAGVYSAGQENIMLEQGSTATDFEPYVGGTASPNPDYPQEIEVVKGYNKVKVCNKNLFDGKITNGSRYDNNTGLIVIDSNSARNTNRLYVKPSSEYCFSDNGTAFNLNIFEYKKDGTFLKSSTYNTSFTTTSETNYINFSRGNDLLNRQLEIEQGSEATEYVEHKEQTYELDFRTGKNLFDGKLELGGYTNGYKDDKTERYRSANKIPVKPNTTYTFSINGVAQKYVYQEYNSSGNYINDADTQTGIFTTSSNCHYITFRCFVADYVSDYANLKVQLEEGSTATEYEEYKTLELAKIGTYQDYIYKDNDKWYKHKEIGKVVFNGSEANWIYESGRFICNFITSALNVAGRQEVYSNYYTYIPSGMADYGAFVFRVNASNTQLYIYNKDYATVADFKTWLSENNVTVYYVIETPTVEEITYIDLIEQLDAILEAKTYSNVTNISTEGNLQPIIYVETFKQLS